jgi:hypothetical protein
LYCIQEGYVTIYCEARIVLFMHFAVFFLSPSSHEVIDGALRLGHFAHVHFTSMLSYFYTHLQLCPLFMAIPYLAHLNFAHNNCNHFTQFDTFDSIDFDLGTHNDVFQLGNATLSRVDLD